MEIYLIIDEEYTIKSAQYDTITTVYPFLTEEKAKTFMRTAFGYLEYDDEWDLLHNEEWSEIVRMEKRHMLDDAI